MADDVTLPGSGAVVSADQVTTLNGGTVSATMVQRVKPVWGPDGSATDTDIAAGLPVVAGTPYLTGTVAAASTAAIGPVDARGYTSGTLFLSGTFTATLAVHTSHDNVTWSPTVLIWNASTTGSIMGGTTTTAGIPYTFAISGGARYVRVWCSVWTSGTVTAYLTLSPTPMALTVMPVAITNSPAMIVSGTVTVRSDTTIGYSDLASAARTTSGTGSSLSGMYRSAFYTVNVTAVSGTAPTLDVKLQGSIDNVNWADIPNAAFATITGTGYTDLGITPGITPVAGRRVSDVPPRYWRMVYTIGGTTPSFTFAGSYSTAG